MLRKLIQGILLLCCSTVIAEEWQWAPDFDIGSQLPPLEFLDANGDAVTPAELQGEHGLLIFFQRSTVW